MENPYGQRSDPQGDALQKIAQELENINQTLRQIYTRMEG